ncbi:MAG: STAS domain-containing protein [Luteolibacter sp.]
MEPSLAVGKFEHFSWIRPTGKGSFLNSPALKSYCESRIAAGEKVIVVDLADCTGMDSTFMGTLAGTASRLTAMDGGQLQIADPGERNRRSLEDLGLDFLMEIDPPAADWRGRLETIRSQLTPLDPVGEGNRHERSLQVLEAHRTLSGVNHQNARSFREVVDTLEKEISTKEKLAKDDDSV